MSNKYTCPKEKRKYAKPGQTPKRAKEYGVRFQKKLNNIKTNGKKSLVEHLYENNLLPAVCVETRKFRIENPLSSYVDLYKHLQSIFGFDFFPDKPLYSGQNFSKQLHQSKEWSASYFASHYDMDSLLETRIQNGLYNNEFDNKDMVKIYDIRQRCLESREILSGLDDSVVEITGL